MSDRPDQIRAPWTPEQVAALNGWQALDHVHPFNCACVGRTILLATTDGWTCPKSCGYAQGWAWEWMADPADPIWQDPLARCDEALERLVRVLAGQAARKEDGP